MHEKNNKASLKMLVDSNIFIALHCSKDNNHKKATEIMEISIEKGIEWVLSDVVFFEAANTMKRRIFETYEKGKEDEVKTEAFQKTIKDYTESHEWDEKINFIYPETYSLAKPVFDLFTLKDEKFQMNDCILYLYSIMADMDGIITFDEGFKNRQVNVFSSAEELAAL